jgi:hypothetical protein
MPTGISAALTLTLRAITLASDRHYVTGVVMAEVGEGDLAMNAVFRPAAKRDDLRKGMRGSAFCRGGRSEGRGVSQKEELCRT